MQSMLPGQGRDLLGREHGNLRIALEARGELLAHGRRAVATG